MNMHAAGHCQAFRRLRMPLEDIENFPAHLLHIDLTNPVMRHIGLIDFGLTELRQYVL
jgi:hypothetical protein